MPIRNVLILTLVATLALAGCATGPRLSEIEASIPPLPPDQGRIYFYRKAVFFGDGLRPPVMLNGEQVGKAVPDGFFFVDRPAGSYVVSTSTEVTRTMSIELGKREEKYVRIAVSMGLVVGHLSPELAERGEALADMRDMHYVGPELTK
jgi:Protein of unknown function (DUF2846)